LNVKPQSFVVIGFRRELFNCDGEFDDFDGMQVCRRQAFLPLQGKFPVMHRVQVKDKPKEESSKDYARLNPSQAAAISSSGHTRQRGGFHCRFSRNPQSLLGHGAWITHGIYDE
jgi:hypothetical protein